MCQDSAHVKAIYIFSRVPSFPPPWNPINLKYFPASMRTGTVCQATFPSLKKRSNQTNVRDWSSGTPEPVFIRVYVISSTLLLVAIKIQWRSQFCKRCIGESIKGTPAKKVPKTADFMYSEDCALETLLNVDWTRNCDLPVVWYKMISTPTIIISIWLCMQRSIARTTVGRASSMTSISSSFLSLLGLGATFCDLQALLYKARKKCADGLNTYRHILVL